MTLKRNQFTDNEAFESGGSVKIFMFLPINDIFAENQFDRNSAAYGPNVASYSIRIALMVTDAGKNK